MSQNLPNLIGALWAIHWPAAPAGGGHQHEDSLHQSGVVLKTCLRTLAFGLAPRPAAGIGSAGEILAGPAAYRLLLEVATGLRSAVPGETNVLGQFKRAWQQSSLRLTAGRRQQLEPLVAALLADTRSVRQKWLQGVAGTSYGSLTRALLAPAADARVLFVGAGDLARSMLPFFQSFQLGVWNRHAVELPLTAGARWFAPDQAEDAAAWADHVVLTTPRDAINDGDWQVRLARHGARSLVHLGQRRADSAPHEPADWPGVAASHDLDDVFHLAGVRDQVRSQRLLRARAACAEVAGVRTHASAGDAAAARLISALAPA